MSANWIAVEIFGFIFLIFMLRPQIIDWQLDLYRLVFDTNYSDLAAGI